MQHISDKQAFYDELIAWIIKEKPTMERLGWKKLRLCKRHKHKKLPTNISIFLHAKQQHLPKIMPYIKTKPMRTGSGVAVVATMTKPWLCSHGTCIFCPGGVGSFFGDTPKSYTGREPSTMRAERNEYDPYRIIFNRLEQYVLLGQSPDKVDQIVMGGTFFSFPKAYREKYISYSFKAYNDFSDLFYRNRKLDLIKFKSFFELPCDLEDAERLERIKAKIIASRDKNIQSLEREQLRNESAKIRCIGLTIETKPDKGFKKHGLELLQLGVTRVELGIQTVYDGILKAINRGHTLADAKKSIAELRDLGFKLNFHVMPGLPDEHHKRILRERDIAGFKLLFSDPAFRPDMLKIYPCMVMPGTPLENIYKRGIYQPLSTQEAADIIVESKRYVPEYCRVMRVQRDIPHTMVEGGVKKTNLRQYVAGLAKKRGVVCRCIRCREIKGKKITAACRLIVRDYIACCGKEFFISMEADDMLLGFIRLRFPPRSLHPAITLKSGLVRELHVYGAAVGIGKKAGENVQHKGIGTILMKKAETIAKKQGKDRMVVISGLGARNYYRKLDYEKDGPYMVKHLG